MSSGTNAFQNIIGNTASLVGNMKAPQSGTPGRPFPVAKFTPRGPGYANPGGTGVSQSIKGAEQQLQQDSAPQGSDNAPLTGNFQPSWMRGNQPMPQPTKPPLTGNFQPGWLKGKPTIGPAPQPTPQPTPQPPLLPRPPGSEIISTNPNPAPGPVAPTPGSGSGFTPFVGDPAGANDQGYQNAVNQYNSFMNSHNAQTAKGGMISGAMMQSPGSYSDWKSSFGGSFGPTGNNPLNQLPIDQQGNVI